MGKSGVWKLGKRLIGEKVTWDIVKFGKGNLGKWILKENGIIRKEEIFFFGGGEGNWEKGKLEKKYIGKRN